MKKNKGTILLMLLVILMLLYPLIDSNTYRLNIAILIGIYSFLATGLNLLVGQTGQISLGHTALFGVGAYASGILNFRLGISFWVCLPISAILAIIVSLLLGITSLRFKGLFLGFVTLGFLIIFLDVIEALDWLTGGAQGFAGISPPKIFGFVFNSEKRYFYLVWIMLIVFSIFAHNICKSRTGRALLSVKQNEVLSNVFGISPFEYKLKAFMLSGIYAGVAGCLLVHYLRTVCIEPFSLHSTVILFAMSTVGGLNSGAIGGIVGAFIITLFPEVISFLSSLKLLSITHEITSDYSYHLIFFGLITMIVVLYFPEGVAGYFIDLWKKNQKIIDENITENQ
jgi:branched-chain amino acid transport system permease protein